MPHLGRKPQGARQVDALRGSAHAKARLKLFLQTLADEVSVGEACRRLGICESRFFEQRTAWLHESIALLEPRPPGRPRKQEPALSDAEVQALQQRLQELEARAAVAEVQTELARSLPHVVARAALPKKTTRPAQPPHEKPHQPK
jgi:hypothetical protein